MTSASALLSASRYPAWAKEVGLEVELYHNESHFLVQSESYRELIPPQFMNIHKINESHQHITLVYFARSNTDHLILSEIEKSRNCRWFTKEELNAPQYNLNNSIKLYAINALEKIIST